MAAARDQRAHEQRLAQESAALAVAEDRLVIARELHDAVSGSLGAITVRCAVAQRLETTPDGLRTALDDVKTASREATDALRRMLTVLRDEHTSPTPGAVATVPAGALGDVPLPELTLISNLAESLREPIGKARRTGVTVDLDVDAIGTDADIAQASTMTDGLPGSDGSGRCPGRGRGPGQHRPPRRSHARPCRPPSGAGTAAHRRLRIRPHQRPLRLLPATLLEASGVFG